MLLVGWVLLVLFAAAMYYCFTRRPNMPPGPRGVPVIGCLPFMELIRKERSYLKWWHQFGPIFTVKDIPTFTSVVMCDADLIREAFNRTSTTSRPRLESINDITFMDVGLVFSTGGLWQRSRRFTLHHLRNFGMGRSRIEAVINGQISEFMGEVLTPSVGSPIDIESSLKIAIANIIWGVISSEEFNIHETRALSVVKTFDTIGDQMFTFLLLGVLPWARHLPASWTGEQRAKAIFTVPIEELFRPAIAEHQKTIDMSVEPRDYIDALLQEQVREPDTFTERHIHRSLLDLFFAGFDTTGSSLLWAFLFLAKHPNVQDRLRQELQQTLGERRPCLANRPQLPYTEAVIMEVQRVANVVPYGVEHLTTEPIELSGYTIPAGTVLVSLLSAVHMDPANFEEPEAFRPDRFLDAEGKLKPSKALIPFGVGKRACLGEALARAELFQFVTSIVKKYRLRFPEGFQHDMSVLEKKVVIRHPTPFQLVFEAAEA